MHTAIELVGWAGAFVVLLAYWLVSHGRLGGTTIRFQLMNIGGALLLGANALYHDALPSVSVNVVWMLIGLLAWRRNARRASAPREGYPSG